MNSFHCSTTSLICDFRKILPLVLHRVEPDLRDIQISVKYSDYCVIRINLGYLKKYALPTSPGYLPKYFAFMFKFQPHLLTPVYSNTARWAFLQRVMCPLWARLQSYASCFNTHPCPLMNILRHLCLSLQRWHCVASQKRPYYAFSDDTSAWLHYAYQDVSETIPSSPPFTLHNVVRVVRACVHYESLHVSRLRRQMHSGEEAFLEKLEDLLDAGMILLLREHARSHVMDENVS